MFLNDAYPMLYHIRVGTFLRLITYSSVFKNEDKMTIDLNVLSSFDLIFQMLIQTDTLLQMLDGHHNQCFLNHFSDKLQQF